MTAGSIPTPFSLSSVGPRRSRIVVLVLALVAALCVAATARAQTASRLTGRVVDAEGRAAAAVEVIVHARRSAAEYRVLTDANGVFTLERLPGDDYLVEARGARGLRAAATSIVLAGDAPGRVELRLNLPSYDEQVVVTAEGRAQPVEEVGKAIAVVSDEDLTRRDEYAVAEAIRPVAGVQIRLDGGPGQLASLRIRGLRADGAAVLIDGLRFRDVTTTQGDASPLVGNLNVINLDRVEVLRGSASSLYGTNAVGGVVNVVSRVGAAQPGGDAQIEVGQLGLTRLRGTHNGTTRDARLRYSVGGLMLKVTGGIDGHDASRSVGAQAAVNMQLAPATSLSGRFWGSDDRADLNTSPSAFEPPLDNIGPGPVVQARLLDPDQVQRMLRGDTVDFGTATLVPGLDDPDDERTSAFWTGAVRFAHRASSTVSIDAHYQRLHSGRTYINRTGGIGFQPSTDNESRYVGDGDTLQALVTADIRTRMVVSGGYELEREAYDGAQRELIHGAGAFAAGTHVSQFSHAVFGRVALNPVAPAHVAGSVRVQAFSLRNPTFTPAGIESAYDGVALEAPATAVTGDLSMAYGLDEGTKLRAHVGNAYRAPSLYERFGGGLSANPADGLVSFTPYGDPRLEPDRYVSFDFGIERTVATGRVRATYFHTWVQQLTEFQFGGAIDSGTDPYGRFGGYLNGGGGRSRGLELEAGGRLGTLTWSTAYTFTDSKTDTALLAPGFFTTPSVARHTIGVTAVEQLGEHLEIVADLFSRSGMYAGFFTAEGNRAYEFPSMVKLDVGAAWLWRLRGGRRMRAQVQIDNLLDRTYYELGWLAAGATLRAGVMFRY